MIRIMVVEDDLSMQKFLCAFLETSGYSVYPCENGIAALELLDHTQVDLIVLDIMMPLMDGFEFTKALREAEYNMPILMLTARSMPEDKKRGFLVGTDDYMTKPVDEEEMLLRIKALLRRAKISEERSITIGDVNIDYDERCVKRGGESVTLPQKEFMLLYKLLSYPNRIFTRTQLMDDIWGMDSEADEVTVNVHINRLRKRFESWPSFEIVTARGLGYKAVKHEA